MALFHGGTSMQCGLLLGAAMGAVFTAAACKDPPSAGDTTKNAPHDPRPGEPRLDAAVRRSASAASESTTGPIPGSEVDASVPIASAAPLDAGPSFLDSLDAGPGACRRVRGPEKMPFVGPAKLDVMGQELRLVTNDLGRPKVVKIAIDPLPPARSPVPELPRPTSTYGTTWPPCAVAGSVAFCTGRGGSITRTDLTVSPPSPKEIAKGRSSTRISAALLDKHTVAAYLDEKQTSEGRTLQAWVVLDLGDPVRLSDDGSGATFVEVVTRGSSVVAMYLDARSAMVPIHERTITLKNGAMNLGKDLVVAVGGAPERGVAGDIATSPTHTFFLIPMPEDSLSFGMAVIKLSDPPKDDEKMAFYRYPNGLDPAPLVATTGPAPIRIARVRPLDKAPTAPRGLELGTLGDDGAFTGLGIITAVPGGKSITDLDIAVDGAGAIWLLYSDAKDTWLERRVCP